MKLQYALNSNTFLRFDTVPDCDGRMDRRTFGRLRRTVFAIAERKNG